MEAQEGSDFHGIRVCWRDAGGSAIHLFGSTKTHFPGDPHTSNRQLPTSFEPKAASHISSAACGHHNPGAHSWIPGEESGRGVTRRNEGVRCLTGKATTGYESLGSQRLKAVVLAAGLYGQNHKLPQEDISKRADLLMLYSRLSVHRSPR